MSTITYNVNNGSQVRNHGLRALICASLAVAITALTMQVIGSAVDVSQPAQMQPATSIQAAAPLPTVTVVASR
ncbi:MAG TPA: hypothetical protein VHX52_14875 [Steroidobacteraceae bacterium]|jgi:hypothetical protein|nr:hypothetical protein [Steroidobacteraceae bacterium]